MRHIDQENQGITAGICIGMVMSSNAKRGLVNSRSYLALMRDNDLVTCMSVNPPVVIEYILKTQTKDRIMVLVILSGFIEVDKDNYER